MNSPLEFNADEGELYLAGERVPPGLYRMIGTTREINLGVEDTLPASLDGRVACYERVNDTWSQTCAREREATRAKME